MEASMLTELPCGGRKSCLQRKKGLAAEKLIETDERLIEMRNPPLRTSKASSQMSDPRRIFSQKRDLLGVSRAPYLLGEEECHLEKGSSSAVEL